MCWQGLQKGHGRGGTYHKPYRLGNGLLVVVVGCREPRQDYSTWEMSEEIEKQSCNSTLMVDTV